MNNSLITSISYRLKSTFILVRLIRFRERLRCYLKINAFLVFSSRRWPLFKCRCLLVSDPTPLVFFRFHYFRNFVFQLRNQKVFSLIVKTVLFTESTSKNPRWITLKNCNSILLFFIIFNVNVYEEKWFFQNRGKESVKIGMLDSINFLEWTRWLWLRIRDGWHLRLLIFFSLECFII